MNKGFLNEETRNGFLVDEKRKKVWKTTIDLLEVFDKFCNENGLRYYVDYGTLLGAVRHKGFIPWDDDIDLVMFRDDYDKMIRLAPDYFKYPFFFQNVYTNPYVVWSFSKLRDDRTTGVEWDYLPADFHQGIFIDIFPLDDVPDNKLYVKGHLKIASELWACCVDTDQVYRMINGEVPSLSNTDLLLQIIQMPIEERFKVYENTLLQLFGTSTRCNQIDEAYAGKGTDRLKEWYADPIYLPFEYIEVPCPKEFDLVLKAQYGDYMTPIMEPNAHDGIILDPDVPYTEYLK